MSAVDSVLKQTARDVAKEAEVQRVLAAFKLNPYDVLDLPAFATESEVKKQYRKKSLMIHPDKFKHEQGHEAFDLLKKAESQLSDENKKAEIDSIMTYSRTQVLKAVLGAGYAVGVTPDDPRLADLKPPYEHQIRAKAKELFVEDEVSKRMRQKMVNVNEKEERERKEAEVANRKRKHEEKQKWEENREERVGNWRDFNKDTKAKKLKKAKKNMHVLG
ncbi:uncharacterized protein EHS24_004479 [Apiotrichum porosum]|uniref:J domain-containing protein n=1 Tax=Apiotrichum porosum TaxID=105984 RepID=A0A427Y579_9TREE|nr:uncharacterized protein EHS24_004479 [Apiotrichum porosum]RSH86241.1 hypothetical protein EHS24_004479 [Apiotrichum porosum]